MEKLARKLHRECGAKLVAVISVVPSQGDAVAVLQVQHGLPGADMTALYGMLSEAVERSHGAVQHGWMN